MDKTKKWLSVDEQYKKQIEKYKTIDGIKALILTVIVFIMVTSLGYFYKYVLFDAGWFAKEISGIISNILMLSVCIAFILLTHSKLNTIGIGGGNKKKSIIFGLIIAFVVGTLNFTSSLYPNCEVSEYYKILIYVVYFFFVAAFEEIAFRGYIQTRIHGLIKNRYIAILVVGLLFALFHFPVRCVMHDVGFFEFTKENYSWLINLVVSHAMFNFVYNRTNSLYGSILIHWVSNLSCYIIAAIN